MKEIVNTLNASGQNISKGELIAFIVDRLEAKYDPFIVHVYSKLDSSNESIVLAKGKLILQKYGEQLNKNKLLTLEVYKGVANYTSQVSLVVIWIFRMIEVLRGLRVVIRVALIKYHGM